MDSNFSYRDTRAPNAEVPRASRVARAPERAMLAAGCTTVIGGPLHRGFVQSASAIVAIDPGRCRGSTLQQRSDIPEEQIWLDKEKSARTRRAYRLDVQHLMRTLSITTRAELRQADHKGGDRMGALHARDRARGGLEVERPAITATKARHSPSRGRRRARSPTRRPKIRSRGFAIARSFLSPHNSDCSAPRSRR
jgi:hypothetical protein